MPFDARPPQENDDDVGTCFAAVDQSVHGTLAELTSGQSPVLTAKAWFDWASHLSISW